jgi:hypothetical protein
MIKDVNIFEQHVEKIVLAVAAAGALYMGWVAMQPLTMPDNTPISEVESKLASQIQNMKETEARNAQLTVAAPKLTFIDKYKQMVEDQPLRKELVDAQIPQFAPEQMALGGVIDVTKTPEGIYKIVTPAPAAPDPNFLKMEPWQQPVAIYPQPLPGQPVQPPPPPPAGQVLPSRDVNAVVITGYIPVGKMQAEMLRQKPADKTALPSNLQRVSIYRIEVQRRQRTPTGWSKWEMVPPTKAGQPLMEFNWSELAGTDVSAIMQQVDTQFKQIVLPDFYYNPLGQPTIPPVLVPPKVPDKALQDAQMALSQEIAKATNSAAPAGAPRFGAPIYTPPAQVYTPPTVSTDLGEIASTDETTGDVQSAPTVDMSGVKSGPMWPFCFWDESVEPDHQYQYQVRVVYVNPTFNWQWGLKDAAMKNKPTLVSDWVPQQPKVVTVQPDLRFFVSNAAMSNGGSVAVRVYKRTFGKWYWGEFSAHTGTDISGQIALVDLKPITQMPVDTGYSVVDVTPTQGGGDMHVVLLENATGKLSTRDTGADRNDQQNKDLWEKAVKRATPPPATRPAGRGPINRGGSGLPDTDLDPVQ